MKTINKLRSIALLIGGVLLPVGINETTTQENEYREQLASNCNNYQKKLEKQFQSKPNGIIPELVSKSLSQEITEQDSKITFAFNIPAESIDVTVPEKGFFTRTEEENCQVAVTTSRMQFIN